MPKKKVKPRSNYLPHSQRIIEAKNEGKLSRTQLDTEEAKKTVEQHYDKEAVSEIGIETLLATEGSSGEEVQMGLGVEREISSASPVQGEPKLNLLDLDERVVSLYEQTRDGIPTPDDYKHELLSPGVPLVEIQKAIRLGTQEWIESSRSKEY